ncbi:hypothetical protein C8R43DRAFT_958809 [Mycena crocata]|nr:hypothetical protein C8R43DRAFT_958809 [Mycena crocata]
MFDGEDPPTHLTTDPPHTEIFVSQTANNAYVGFSAISYFHFLPSSTINPSTYFGNPQIQTIPVPQLTKRNGCYPVRRHPPAIWKTKKKESNHLICKILNRDPRSGRLICIARVKVIPGKEPLFEQLITASGDYASSAEPGTLTYRKTRIIDKEGKPTGEYVIFEEYAGKAAYLAHEANNPPLKAMFAKKDELTTAIAVEFSEEF